jgi:hypothetical protein
MREVAAAAPVLQGEAGRRAEAALAQRAAPTHLDIEAARARLDRLMRAAPAGMLAS